METIKKKSMGNGSGLVVIDSTVSPPRVKFPGKPETLLYITGEIRDFVEDLCEMGYDVSWTYLARW